jgi:hypothetical protein
MFRFMSLSSLAVLFGVSVVLAVPTPKAETSMEKTLKSKDFYDKGLEISDAEMVQVAALANESKDPLVKVRARKLVVEQAGNGRNGDAELTKAAFKYLEDNLKNASVKALLVDQGFSHYTTSARNDGTTWFLIEHVQAQGFNGGLNLRYDAQKKQIVEMKAWGAVPAVK